jgi:hypothetical protein
MHKEIAVQTRRSARCSWQFLLLLMVSCTQADVTVSETDRELAGVIAVDDAQLGTIKQHGSNLQQLTAPDYDSGEPKAAPGLMIDVDQDDAMRSLGALRAALGGEFTVFIAERQYGFGPDRLAVIRSSDQFEPLRIMQTNGLNYDVSPDAVIERLQQWDTEFGLEIHGVGFDWVEASFREQPADMAAFAAQVYQWCPDVVDQGTETVARLAQEMARSNTLYLWWD